MGRTYRVLAQVSSIVLLVVSSSAWAGTVSFVNNENTKFELHVRNGPIDRHPDDRGSQNTTLAPGETFQDEVGDGDTWFAYGNKLINYDENPELCNAQSGDTVVLDRSQSCFDDN